MPGGESCRSRPGAVRYDAPVRESLPSRSARAGQPVDLSQHRTAGRLGAKRGPRARPCEIGQLTWTQPELVVAQQVLAAQVGVEHARVIGGQRDRDASGQQPLVRKIADPKFPNRLRMICTAL